MNAFHHHRRRPSLLAVLAATAALLLVAGAATAVVRTRGTDTSSPAAPVRGPAPGPGSGPATTGTTAALPPEPAYVTEAKKQVSELRGLAWKRPLEVDVVSKAELARRARAANERDLKPDRLAGDGETYKVLHLIPSGTDYAKTVQDLLSGLILGFYDPLTKELVVGDSGGDVDGGTKVTLAHELDHALTDQWFDFGTRLKALDDADRQEEVDALGALVEGDAKLLEGRYIDRYLTEEEQLAYALGGLVGGDEGAVTKLARTPQFLLDYLYFPYIDGLAFVEALADPRGFAAVNDAYGRPPTSTEQILHPELYKAGQGAASPAPPDVAGAGSCTVERRGTLGEFKMGEVLDAQLDGATADAAAAGWNGDAFATLRCGSSRAFVDRWQADSDAAATRLAAALSRWGQGWARSGAGTGGRFSGPGGAGRVVQNGSQVELVLADDAATANRL